MNTTFSTTGLAQPTGSTRRVSSLFRRYWGAFQERRKRQRLRATGLRAMVQERLVRVERRLSAILAADVAGYSRLMHNDEEATHTKLTTLLSDAVAPEIADHGGRIVKRTGDGFLAEFPSAVEAVRAAVQFQTRIKELTVADAEDKRIAFRVGINIGDVIVEPHDIFGDGVNIAARLEGIAEPGGICISSSAYDYVRGKVGVEFADLGEQNLKNIALPVRAYAAVRDGSSAATQAERVRLGPLLPHRLSIVVLPFANLSGDPEQDLDGVTDSLTTDLSRISGSFVIGRHSAFTYKSKAVDLKEVGRELGVRYELEGSLQRCGSRLRVNVQIVDAETSAHPWPSVLTRCDWACLSVYPTNTGRNAMRKSMMLSSALMLVTGAASAGELPKEGNVTGTYYGSGTYKAAPMGKDALISGWEETGYTLGGVFDHVTWHCLGGFRAFTGKSSAYTGHCVGTDTAAGDQLVMSVESADESPPEVKARPDKLRVPIIVDHSLHA